MQGLLEQYVSLVINYRSKQDLPVNQNLIMYGISPKY